METIVSESGNVAGMAKKEKTVPIYARLPESDVALVDKAAEVEKVSRSMMVARIVRDWAKTQVKRLRR